MEERDWDGNRGGQLTQCPTGTLGKGEGTEQRERRETDRKRDIEKGQEGNR